MSEASTPKADGKRRVFLTGPTGIMGSATLRELAKRLDRFDITLLARDSKANRRKLAPYIGLQGVRVVWGDLLRFDDVLRGVQGADVVLHVGGMVSPAADYFPEKTFKVNTVSMRHIVDAVKLMPRPDEVAVVYIGSVAQYGPCPPPRHWARCGDTLRVAKMDAYASSKIAAERILSDSGLKKWVSLRQTAILSKALLNKAFDPITFHVPIKGVLEWVTDEDSGRLLANVCEEWVPEGFWQRRFYNVGGGKSFRLTNYEFERGLMRALHCPPPEKIFDVRWFATENFHGMWPADSDELEQLLHFRSGKTFDDYLREFSASLPWYYSLTPLAPAPLMKMVMRWVAGRNRLAPLYWLKHGMTERIDIHFGGIDKWRALPGWSGTDLSRPSETPRIRPHGYDEAKPTSQLGLADMKEAARFRGGECLSDEMKKGDMATLLRWRDASGAEFDASPASVLLGGHWGPPIDKPF